MARSYGMAYNVQPDWGDSRGSLIRVYTVCSGISLTLFEVILVNVAYKENRMIIMIIVLSKVSV